ncbi:MAG: hypothetical protein AUK44_08775 [Porphyromonadaceae bacterium CG2_30_38_12]|nr:MAG: hypothetical protein AUK44_08775 [Porphyromonadaceae bacterium CG2_30_38_12]
MVLAYIQHISTANTLLLSASQLAVQLGKNFGILVEGNSTAHCREDMILLEHTQSDCSISPSFTLFTNNALAQIADFCESKEISFLFLQLSQYSSKSIRLLLNACRGLRIPYILFKDSFNEITLDKVFVPVTFLEEEVEKAQFASAFARFCNAKVFLFQANDYGSKAATNTKRINELLQKFNLQIVTKLAQHDSFKIEREIVVKAMQDNAGLVILTASREYGLDDIIFGPKELKLVKLASMPVLLINPRGDLYALCD